MSVRKDRGQATVEFALILPAFVLVMAALVWVANLMLEHVRLEHAAREGARAAAIEPASASAAAERAVARVDPSFEVSTVVEAEVVSVRVARTVAGVPIVGVGQRRVVAEVVMRREDRITP